MARRSRRSGSSSEPTERPSYGRDTGKSVTTSPRGNLSSEKLGRGSAVRVGGSMLRVGKPAGGVANRYQLNADLSLDPSNAGYRSVIYRGDFRIFGTGLEISPTGTITRAGDVAIISPARTFFQTEVLSSYVISYLRSVRQQQNLALTELVLWDQYDFYVSRLLQDYYGLMTLIQFTTGPYEIPEMESRVSVLLQLGIADVADAMRRRIIGLPIPPNYHRFWHWVMQAYVSDAAPGSAALFFASNATLPSTDIVGGVLQDNLLEMQDTNFLLFCSELANLRPDWVVRDVMPCADAPRYDLDFMNGWTNMPIFRTDIAPAGTPGASFIYPLASNGADIQHYYVGDHVDVISTAFHGMTTVPVTGDLSAVFGAVTPGVFYPSESQSSYYTLNLDGELIIDGNGLNQVQGKIAYGNAGFFAPTGAVPVSKGDRDMILDMYEFYNWLWHLNDVKLMTRASLNR